jgi:hypothetical protein
MECEALKDRCGLEAITFQVTGARPAPLAHGVVSARVRVDRVVRSQLHRNVPSVRALRVQEGRDPGEALSDVPQEAQRPRR